MKSLHSVQARLWGVAFATLMGVHSAAMAQGSAQTDASGDPAATATATSTASDTETKESLTAAFGPIALAGLAVMTLLVRRRPMR